MSILSVEANNVQNPALGALLLWRFVVGYSESNSTHDSAPLPLLFLVLAIAFHEETMEQLHSTRQGSGLRAFIGKFSESKISKNDLILAVQGRAAAMRPLSLDALRLALSAKLLLVDTSKGLVTASSVTAPKAGIPESVRSLCRAVGKLGAWCGQLSLHEIAVNLKVSF